MPSPATNLELLRAEIAAVAARMIVEDGADYGSAKRKAVRMLLGEARVNGNILPPNAQVEEEVRLYQALFHADTQPARLARLRQLALDLMERLAEFHPFITGAVLNGTAGEHSDLHLQLFTYSPKDVEIFLIDQGIDYTASEGNHFHRRGEPVETVSFMMQGEGVHLALFDYDDLRVKSGTERADRNTLQQIMIGEDKV